MVRVRDRGPADLAEALVLGEYEVTQIPESLRGRRLLECLVDLAREYHVRAGRAEAALERINAEDTK